MNNTVGYAPTAALRRAALGTDGVDQDMLAESRAAFLQMRESGREDAYAATLELLAGGALTADGWLTRVPLADGQAACEDLADRGRPFKVLLELG
jgi:hypothetical protein